MSGLGGSSIVGLHPISSAPMSIVIDWIEGEVAILEVGPDSHGMIWEIDIPAVALPEGASEGASLKLELKTEDRSNAGK